MLKKHKADIDGSMTRKRLREEIEEKVDELRRRQVRRRRDPRTLHSDQKKMDTTRMPVLPSNTGPAIKLHERDAIARLINTGRQHRGGQEGELLPLLRHGD